MEEAKDFTKIYGLDSKIISAKIIGDNNGKVNFKTDRYGDTTIYFPRVKFDQDVTVVELNFNEKIKFSKTIKKKSFLCRKF